MNVRVFRVLAFFASVYACTASQKIPRLGPFDPMLCPSRCEVHYLKFDPEFTREEKMAMEDAFDIWRKSTGGRECFQEGPGVMVIKVDSELAMREFAKGTPGLDPKMLPWGLWRGGKIYMHAHQYGLYPTKFVMAHELGHMIGFNHIDGRPSLLNTIGGTLDGDLLNLQDRLEYCKEKGCFCDGYP